MTQNLAVTLQSGLLYVTGTVNGVETTWTNTDGDTWETTADRASDDVYRIELTMIDSGGLATTAALTLYYGLLNLITDRTLADVAEADRLIAKLREGGTLTESERAAYFAGLRGCYNTSDMNRVGAAAVYMRDRMTAEGYPARIEPRTDYQMSEKIRIKDWRHYIDELKILRAAMPLADGTPTITDDMYSGIDWQQANDIERFILVQDETLTRVIRDYIYAGEIFAGEV